MLNAYGILDELPSQSCPHFANEETQAQRSVWRSHRQVVEQGDSEEPSSRAQTPALPFPAFPSHVQSPDASVTTSVTWLSTEGPDRFCN